MDWRVRWGVGFLMVAALFNGVHFLLFRDAEYISKFIIAQLGFLPVSVFLVTVVLNQLLARREKAALLNKMNMVIGAFFSEVGNGLLGFFNLDFLDDQTRRRFMVRADWQTAMFDEAEAAGAGCNFKTGCRREDFQAMRRFLLERRDFLLALLANPNLLEHDSFTETLWAVLHLTEELACREDLTTLPEKDVDHLMGDIERAFKAVFFEWLSYMRHLQADYPYLFSLAVRTNPLNPQGRPEIH